MITLNAAGNRVKLSANGFYRIFPNDLGRFSSISAIWTGKGVNPSGTLSFSVDGDPGQNAELGVINLSQVGQTGSRTCSSNMNFAFVDVQVTGLPDSGQVMLYLR